MTASIAFKSLLLAAASGILLGLSALFPTLFVLAWLSFVPLLLALENKTPGQAYLIGSAAGLTLFVVCSYWAIDFVQLTSGYEFGPAFSLVAIYWLYSAQLLGLLALVFSWLRRSAHMPDIIVFPVLVVCFFAFFPSLFSVQVGETQSLFLAAIQATDITGVYGLDFVIALVNVLVFQLLLQRKTNGQTERQQNRLVYPALGVVALWMGYGFFSLASWDQKISTWDTKKIGFVQSHEAPSTERAKPQPGYSLAYPPEMATTNLIIPYQPELIIWPETRLKGYFKHDHVQSSFQNQIAKLETPLIFQDINTIHQEDRRRQYNESLLIGKTGDFDNSYRKRKLMPFGEYLPFGNDLQEAEAFARKILGNFYGNLDPGSSAQIFRVANMKLVPLICYEVMFPVFVAEALQNETGQILVGQSNNGWFGDTRQPYQHLYASVLRSVENRVPLVHVVNNGPSGVVLPSGRLGYRSSYHKAAGYVVELPFNEHSGGSFFSRHPRLFINGVLVVLSLIVFQIVFKRFRRTAAPPSV